MAKKTEAVNVVIPSIDIRNTVIRVVGDTPLIVHKWSEKAKKEILDKQMKKAKAKGHDAKDPVADFIDTLYWLEGEPEEKTEEGFANAIANGARFGFPATAFKQAAIMGAYRAGVGISTTVMKGAFHINCEYIEIKGNVSMREDMVKVGGISKVADIRYRAQIENWSANIPVKYNAGVISLEQVVNLFNLGGFSCGVGEWRTERDGTFGSFHVE
ncbi:MAG: hypothetical protein E7661_00730 [Ruminococcaceae bacterium]|nr:hypothetical protein [Oscillospiraceae bacterium]